MYGFCEILFEPIGRLTLAARLRCWHSHLLLAMLCTSSVLSGQSLDKPQLPPGERPSPAAIQAWQARKFGMFIHFGLYSMLGGEWQGRRITNGYSEQIMSHAPIGRDEYAASARQFNPVNFDPEAIVALAQQAGMKFIVVTSKHHDGFNLFQTKETDFNVVDGTPYRRDIIKQLSEACARHGMKFGVYYSSIDWHDRRATPFTDDNDNPIPKTHENLNVAQLKELTTNYGPLSEVWFDMGRPTPDQSKRFTDTVHAAQPDCMVSGRVFNYQGDFTVMGDNEVPKFLIDEPWQTPASIYADTWGYRSWAERTDLTGKIQEHILKLAEVVSRGGNYILNIGPRGDGSVVPFEASVLQGVGEWLKLNGEAIYGAAPQPFRELEFGYATVKPGKLFLLVKQWPADGKLKLPGLENALDRAYFLTDASRRPFAVENRLDAKAVRIPVTSQKPGLNVIAVEYSGALRVLSPAKKLDSGDLVLTEQEADHFLNYNGRGYYDKPTIYKLKWTVRTATPCRVRVRVVYELPARPQRIEVVAGKNRRILTLSPVHDGGRPGKSETDLLDLETGGDIPVEITPPEPFTKGEKLPAEILRIELQLPNR